jgi:hypothetical protein
MALMSSSNPFLVDNLLKIVWFQFTISINVKSWLAIRKWLVVKAVENPFLVISSPLFNIKELTSPTANSYW